MAKPPSASVTVPRPASSTETCTRSRSSPPTAFLTVPLTSAAGKVALQNKTKAARRAVIQPFWLSGLQGGGYHGQVTAVVRNFAMLSSERPVSADLQEFSAVRWNLSTISPP